MPLSTVQGHEEELKGWYLLREFASCQVQERLQTVLLSLGVKGRTAGTSVVSQIQETKIKVGTVPRAARSDVGSVLG